MTEQIYMDYVQLYIPRQAGNIFTKVIAFLLAASCAMSALGGEQILLETKDVTITDRDFEADIARIPEADRTEVLSSRERISKLLENLLVNKTLAKRARDAGLDRDPFAAKQMELAADKVLASSQIEKDIKQAPVPDFNQRAYEIYQVDIDKYTRPARVHASQILVDINKDRTLEEALQRIKMVRDLALSGKPFADLAAEYSDESGAKQTKGDLGFFTSDRMVKEFSDAAFAMHTPGEISEPVKTKFGYHLIQFHEMKPKEIIPFDKVKDKILNMLREKYLKEYRQNIISDILSDPSMKLNEAAVDRYRTVMPEIPVNRPRDPSAVSPVGKK